MVGSHVERCPAVCNKSYAKVGGSTVVAVEACLTASGSGPKGEGASGGRGRRRGWDEDVHKHQNEPYQTSTNVIHFTCHVGTITVICNVGLPYMEMRLVGYDTEDQLGCIIKRKIVHQPSSLLRGEDSQPCQKQSVIDSKGRSQAVETSQRYRRSYILARELCHCSRESSRHGRRRRR